MRYHEFANCQLPILQRYDESFSSHKDIVIKTTGQDFHCEFTTKSGYVYRIEIEYDDSADRMMNWVKKKIGRQPKDTYIIRFGAVNDKGGLTIGVTGTGNEFEVFGKVLSAVTTFIKDHQPHRLWYIGSNTDGHAALYDRMLRAFSKALASQGYTTKSYPMVIAQRSIKSYIIQKS